jgi:hypothetical protein
MDHLRSVSRHFIHSIFNISAGTPIAGRIADNFDFHIPVSTERAFPVSQ